MPCVLNKENIEKVKRIEMLAYPPHMRMYDDVETPEDVMDYADCEGQFFCHIDDGWYMLGCDEPGETFVADLAASRSLGFTDLNKVMSVLRGMGDKKVTAECRQSTSYRLLKLAERRGLIEVLSDKTGRKWGNDTMREVEFLVKPIGFREWLQTNEALDPSLKDRLEKINPKVYPDREKLAALIAQMEEEPGQITPKDAFARVNASAATPMAPAVSAENATLKKFGQLVPRPSPAMLGFKSQYEAKRMTTPEFLSLAFFASKGASDDQLELLAREMGSLAREWKEKIYFKEVPQIATEYGVHDYQKIEDFSSAVHTLMGLADWHANKGKDGKLYFDPKVDVRPDRHKDLLVDGTKGGIWIYKGSNPAMCRLYGKETTWCIASSTSTLHYFDYRINNGQTQYFIFDTNKDKDDPARMTNPGVAPEGQYSEWVDLRNNHSDDEDGNGFGINGYSSIADYKDYLAGKIGISVDKLDSLMAPEPVTDAEKRLKKYLDDYARAS
jgi:hypothetical protein